MFYFILGFLVVYLTHELGHYIMAKILDTDITFKLTVNPSPRCIFFFNKNIPAKDKTKIAQAGFGASMMCMLPLILFAPLSFVVGYAFGQCLEWWTYDTSSKHNDFNFLDSDD